MILNKLVDGLIPELPIETESQLEIETQFLDARQAVILISRRLRLTQIQENILLSRVLRLEQKMPEVIA